MNRKTGEWIQRIICFTIFESLIAIFGFVVIGYSTKLLTEMNLFNWKVGVGLAQSSLAIAYLQIANIFYWWLDINLLDFKKLWRKKNALPKN